MDSRPWAYNTYSMVHAYMHMSVPMKRWGGGGQVTTMRGHKLTQPIVSNVRTCTLCILPHNIKTIHFTQFYWNTLLMWTMHVHWPQTLFTQVYARVQHIHRQVSRTWQTLLLQLHTCSSGGEQRPCDGTQGSVWREGEGGSEGGWEGGKEGGREWSSKDGEIAPSPAAITNTQLHVAIGSEFKLEWCLMNA